MQSYLNELNSPQGQAFPLREKVNGPFILQEAVGGGGENAIDEAKEILVELEQTLNKHIRAGKMS